MFDVKKHLIKVQGGRDYLPVAYRLVWFREEHPDWGIATNPVTVDYERGVAVFQASVFNTEGRLLASGTKMETARGFADFVEKAETGAIGRALGVLGYGTQFAPEFDEGERVADSPPPKAAPAPADPAAVPVTQKTLSSLHAHLPAHGLTHEDLHAEAQRRFGVESVKELSEAQARDLAKWIKSLPELPEGAPEAGAEDGAGDLYDAVHERVKAARNGHTR